MDNFFNKESAKTPDGIPSQGCSDCEDDYCKSSGEVCDGCYDNLLKYNPSYLNL